MSNQFQRLLQPLRVGALTLRHRLIMGPMADWMWDGGAPVEGLTEYYLARARGGAALITIGATEIHAGYQLDHRGSLAADRYIPALRRLTDAVHATGTPMLIQLHHGGSSANPAVSPSGVASLSTLKAGFIESRALTLAEVKELRDHFIAAARRAQLAGFDGVELAGQASYLLGQFFSPRLNQRTDRYGGGVGQRMTLAVEILQGIRAECSDGFVVGYAISADELQPNGVTVSTCLPFARALESAGLDYLDVRVGTHESFAMSPRATGHSRYQARTGIFEYSAEFKRALRIPVFCSVQGCYEPRMWEQALAEQKTDVIQLGKPLVAEPALPAKLFARQAAQIRPCIYCMHCLDPFTHPKMPPQPYCAINAETGAERILALVLPQTPRTVLVVGGGPAGLEAARVAAECGHTVTLLEKEAELGGNLRWIGRCVGGDVYLRWRDWLVHQCSTAGVTLQTGMPVTAAVVAAHAADVVIVAIGAGPAAALAVKGSEKRQVMSFHDALSGIGGVRGHVVVVGGGQEGLQTAATLVKAEGVRSVTIVESRRAQMLGEGMAMMERAQASMTQLAECGVQAVVGVRVVEIRNREVLLVDTEDGGKQRLNADTVVVALPAVPDHRLHSELQLAGIHCHVVGDARQSGTIGDAIHAAAQLARHL